MSRLLRSVGRYHRDAARVAATLERSRGRRPHRHEQALVIAGDVAQALDDDARRPEGDAADDGDGQRGGRTITYEGVLVGELLKRAGAPVGSELLRQRGRHLRARERQGRLSGRVLAGGTGSRLHGQRHHRRRHRRREAALRLSGTVPARRAARQARARGRCACWSGSRSSGSRSEHERSGAFACVVSALWSAGLAVRCARRRARLPPGGLPAGFPRPRVPRQPDVRGQGRARPASLLRHAPLGQRDAVVRHLPRAGARLHRRARTCGRLDRPGPPARQHEPRQCRLRRGADLGAIPRDPARRSGAGADVRRAADRARPRPADGLAGRGCARTRATSRCSRRAFGEPDPFIVATT